ncbi:MAG: lycopene cyclase domain-containing protein [Cyclobacteriaceae bacterium]
MNIQFTYALILAGSIAGPLALSFDKKVAFHTKWTDVIKAGILPAAIFIAWDMFFTKEGVWSFSEKHITGIKIGNLPIEEALFFFVVPFCCLFIYECIRCWFPSIRGEKLSEKILIVLGVALFVAGLLNTGKYYTSWTGIANGIFIALIFLAPKLFCDFRVNYFLVSYAVILIPFLTVNGLLTSIPVVLYNDAENLALRIYTIPTEDVFYGMLLILMNITIYERLRAGKKS